MNGYQCASGRMWARSNAKIARPIRPAELAQSLRLSEPLKKLGYRFRLGGGGTETAALG